MGETRIIPRLYESRVHWYWSLIPAWIYAWMDSAIQFWDLGSVVKKIGPLDLYSWSKNYGWWMVLAHVWFLKFNLKLKKNFYIFIYKVRFQAGGWARKRSSLTTDPGPCRINLERRNIWRLKNLKRKQLTGTVKKFPFHLIVKSIQKKKLR